MFRAVPLPIIRSFPLYIWHWYMSCRFDDSFQSWPGWSCLKAVIKPAWHTPVPYVQWKTPDDGQRNCPKHLEFLDKNKFGKLVCLLVLLKRNLYVLGLIIDFEFSDVLCVILISLTGGQQGSWYFCRSHPHIRDINWQSTEHFSNCSQLWLWFEWNGSHCNYIEVLKYTLLI